MKYKIVLGILLLLLLLCVGVVNARDTDDFLNVYVKMDYNASDFSGNGYATSNIGVVYEQTGFVDYSGLFVASELDYVTISDVSWMFQDGLNFTLMVWVKPDINTDNARTTLDKSHTSGSSPYYEIWMRYNSVTNVTMFYLWQGSVYARYLECESDQDLAVGSWHHLALVGDAGAGTLHAYINGTLVCNDTTPTGTFGTSTSALYVGKSKNNGEAYYHWNGGMDEIRIYNTSLTASEVLDVVNGTESNNLAPVMQEVSITPFPYAYDFQNLTTSCNATDNTNLTFNVVWYRNNTYYSNSTYSQNNVSFASEDGQGIHQVGYTSQWDNINNAFNGVWGGASANCPISETSCAVGYNHSSSPTVKIATYNIGLWISGDQGAANPQYEFYCGELGDLTLIFIISDETDNGSVIISGGVPNSCLGEDYIKFILKYSRNGGDETAVFSEENVTLYYYNDSTILQAENTSVGDGWLSSCRAYDGELYSSWLNSSVTTILPSAPEFSYSDVDTGLNDLTLTIDTRDSVNISVSGVDDYINASYSQNKSFTFSGLNPHSFYDVNITICNQINNCSSLGLVGLTKTRLNFTAWEIISGVSISTFETNVTFRNFFVNQSNSTTSGLISFVVGNDTHSGYGINGNATTSATNYLNVNYSTFNPRWNHFNSTIELSLPTFFYSSVLNVTAFDSSGAEISDFNITLTSLNYSYTLTQNTSINWTSFNLVNGTYNISIQAHGYADNSKVYTVQGLDYEVLNFTLLSGGWVYFYFYDEDTDVLIADRNISLEVISVGYANNFSTSTGMLGTNLTADEYTFRYWAYDYPERLYYMNIFKKGNYSTNLYLLKNDSSEVVTVTLIDQYNTPIEDHTIKLLKYDLSTNSYILRDMEKTNVVGEARVTAELFSEFYKFVVEAPSGSVKLETSPAYITSDTITLQIIIGDEGAADFFNSFDVNYNLLFNELTGNFKVTFSDPNNLITRGCLYLYRVSALNGSDEINSSCISSTTGTILLPVENITGVTYKADFYIYYDESIYFLDSVDYTYSEGAPFGNAGLFFTVLLLILFAFLGVWSLEMVVIVEPVIILISAVLGFIELPVSMALSLVILGIIIAVLISKRGRS